MIRQIAAKLSIIQILKAEFHEEASEPNYLLVQGTKISRINIIAIIVGTSLDFEANYRTFVVDDGSGSLPMRIFDSVTTVYTIGDCVQIIGKPRMYGSEKYIIPEIMKKIDVKFLGLRNKELPLVKIEHSKEEVTTPVHAQPDRISERILKMIQEKDQGEGVFVHDVLEHINDPNGEKVINSFLEQGIIFETKPGKVKILD